MATAIRWRLEDDPEGQGTLFDEEVERHIGRGEFRGLEFLHVRAQRIINTLPPGAPLPFRHTINAYRGCSHACSYCVSGDTPVLLANGRTRPIADLRPGDMVYGTQRVGDYRRYVPSQVLDHWSTIKRAYRITLEDGTALVASGDHRLLSDRGWKHVTGAEQGAGRRPHLTTSNKLIGTGQFADPPKHDEEYLRGYLCGMIRGDGTIGSYRYERTSGGGSSIHLFRLALTDEEALRRSAIFLQLLGVPTSARVFQAATATTRRVDMIVTQRQAGVDRVRHLIAWPDEPSDSWTNGFLAGIFDAEGSCSRGVLRISNKDEEILGWITDSLDRFGFRWVREGPNETGCWQVRLVGGLQERLRFFHTVDPAITRKRTFDGLALKTNARLGVVSIEDIGIEIPMYDITTTTGDFIADGVVSHNCFARPTHDYLGLNTTDDFDSKIVVKINAVERLRAELDPRRWPGDPIAMGTNTDPYQRCEGKYHLTRGLIEVLLEHGNPFSILTKSTLILRDLDLLAEAGQRGLATASLSVGTLDEQVWRESEPGTPHPRKRLEAVARLNEAGLPTGVLMGPILPGLSDDPAQLEEVVKGAVEAGATSISSVLLHLRPGVREVYLPWLERTHPELVERYQKLYAGSYAPKADRQRVSDQVRRLISRFRGTPAAPFFRPRTPPAPKSELPAGPRQLPLL